MRAGKFDSLTSFFMHEVWVSEWMDTMEGNRGKLETWRDEVHSQVKNPWFASNVVI